MTQIKQGSLCRFAPASSRGEDLPFEDLHPLGEL